MDEDWGSCFLRQEVDRQSPTLNYYVAPFRSEHHLLMKPISVQETLPQYPSVERPCRNVYREDEPCHWFYCLPRYEQVHPNALSDGIKEKIPAASCGENNEVVTPKIDSACSQRKFVVFDKSGDQTTVIFSSAIGTPAPYFTSWAPKPTGACELKREDLETDENLNIHLRAINADQFGDNDGVDLQSEMHEDTDELNALLYSDDESDYSEDEVTSTGHSPSTMTAHNNQDMLNGCTEEVLSKKRKLFDGGYNDIPSLMDTASSGNRTRSSENEDDAESRCDDPLYVKSGEMGSEWNNKKIRKDRIRDTVSILQNIIPCGKGKNAIVVLDEAISYLKSLKMKAEALGLDAP